ncbi:MAG: 2-dehydropantoate 2-reductase [Vulcanimicrobiaceae bacterium]
MRIAVVGAGAIGGFIAAMIARNGDDVSVVARGEHLAAIKSAGLAVKSDAGTFTVKVPATDDLRQLGTFDALFVAVKAHQFAGLLPQLAPSIVAGATIIPVINGLPFWYFRERTLESVDPAGHLRKMIPRSQIVGCVIHASGNIPLPGVIHQSGGMQYILGDPDGGPSDRAEKIGTLLTSAGMEAPVVSTIKRETWRKLLGNASLNPVSALTRLSIRPMLQAPETRRLIALLMEETSRVASATGVEVEISIDDRIAYAMRLADVKTSMLQDVEAGRPLELDPIVGAVVELAEQFAVRAPTLHMIYALTKALESSYLRNDAR